MLSSMVKEHQTRQQLRREEQERHRKEALQASTSLTNALVDHLNVGVAQAYLNQKRLDGEARRLEQSAAVLQKQTQHWITLVNGFCSALKQVGDVASWTKAIHRDVATVAATLQIAYADTYARTHPGAAQGSTASTLGPLGLLQAPGPVHGTRAVTASVTVIPATADTGSVTASSSVSSSSSPKSNTTVRGKKSTRGGSGGGATVTVVAAVDTFEDDDGDTSASSGRDGKGVTSILEPESDDVEETGNK